MSYELAKLPELLTAPWVQAWGSMLGSALAVTGAVWFQRRAERKASRDIAWMVGAVVDRIEEDLTRLADLIEYQGTEPELETWMRRIIRHSNVLAKFSPFTALQSFSKAEHLISLEVGLDELIGHQHLADQQKTQALKTHAMFGRLFVADREVVLQLATDAKLLCHMAKKSLAA